MQKSLVAGYDVNAFLVVRRFPVYPDSRSIVKFKHTSCACLALFVYKLVYVQPAFWAVIFDGYRGVVRVVYALTIPLLNIGYKVNVTLFYCFYT